MNATMADATAVEVREDIEPAQARAAALLMIGVTEAGLEKLTVRRFADQECVRLDAICDGEDFAKITSVKLWEWALVGKGVEDSNLPGRK
jgi:hypothetical protein